MKRMAVILMCALALLTARQELPARAEGDMARNHYALDVALDVENSRLTERIELTLVNDSADEWSEVCLRDFMDSVLSLDDERCGVGMSEADEQGNIIAYGPTLPPDSRHLNGSSGVISARQDGQELRFYADSADSSIVHVALKQPLAPGRSATLELDYAADVPCGGYRCAWSSLDSGAYGRHVTYELAQFYPMLAIYEDGEWICDPYFSEGECFYTRCADYDVALRVPEGYEVIASGDEARGATADGVTEWSVSARNMRDVTVIVSNELECMKGEVDGVAVNSYYCAYDPEGDPVGSSRAQGEVSLAAAQAALKAFADEYGAYPYAELDVVESCYEYGGMEAPGLVRISEMYSWFILDEDEAERAYYTDRLRGTVAHEVAHEWFYAVVGNNQYREAWLDESLAAFSEQIYWRAQGRSEDEIAAYMAELAACKRHDGSEAICGRYDELDYVSAVYRRGAAFLYGLEQALGEESFAGFMQSYYAAHAFSEATTRDFLSELEPYMALCQEARKLVERYLPGAD